MKTAAQLDLAPRRERGFSLIELLVAILIAGVAFGALVPLFIQMQKTSNADKLRSVALQVSQDRIEKIRQLKYELITVDNLKSSTFNAGQFGTTWSETGESGSKRNYAITYKVEEKSPSADARSVYKVVTVSTEWVGAPTPHKAAVLTTMVYPQSAGPRVADFSSAVPPAQAVCSTRIPPPSPRWVRRSSFSKRGRAWKRSRSKRR